MVQKLETRESFLKFERMQTYNGWDIPITANMALKILDTSRSTLFRWEKELSMDISRVAERDRRYSDSDLLLLAKKRAGRKVDILQENGFVKLHSSRADTVLQIKA